VAALVTRAMRSAPVPQTLQTFSIGMEGSTDLMFARRVAEHIGSQHHGEWQRRGEITGGATECATREVPPRLYRLPVAFPRPPHVTAEVVVTEEQMLAAVPEVVAAIESYDITSVRASVGNYLVCKHIAAHTDIKVVFNGDGSDEVSADGGGWARCAATA
jgi:asparagine synthase (glutamine-hydrolysing)